MLFFFRNIHFATALTLAVYTFLLHAAAIGGFVPLPSNVPGGLLYHDCLNWIQQSPQSSAIVAAMLVWIQAIAVNGISDKFRLMPERNWLPGMCYALAASLLPDFLFVSPPLLASTGLILSLYFVFGTYKSPKSPVLVFDAAFWLGVAALFLPSAIFLAPAAFIGIGIMRSWRVRDQVAFLAGLLTPLFLAWTWYFWHDAGADFRQTHFSRIFQLVSFNTSVDPLFWTKAGILGFLLLSLLLGGVGLSKSKSMMLQKSIAVMYWLILIGAAALLFYPDWHWATFVLTAAPVGILLALALQDMRHLFAELLHAAILCMALIMQWWSLF